MIEWDDRALKAIQERRPRPQVVWTPSVLLRLLGLENNPRNRRLAKKALEHLWQRNVLVRRLEVHDSRATMTSPVIKETAYSLPEFVLHMRTTRDAAYDPHTGGEFLTNPHVKPDE